MSARGTYHQGNAGVAGSSEFARGVAAWVIVSFVLIGLMELPLLGSVSRDAMQGLSGLSTAVSALVRAEKPASGARVPAVPTLSAANVVSQAKSAGPAARAGGAAAPAASAPVRSQNPVAAPLQTPGTQLAVPSAPAAPAVAAPAQTSAPIVGPTAPPASALPTSAPVASAVPSPTAAPAPTANVPAAAQAPRAPAAYSVPAGAVAVASSAQLLAALQRSTSTDIVLADGIYDNPAPFPNANGHRIFAEHLLGATLRAGVLISSNYGLPNAVIRGIAFDVTDRNKTFQGAIVFTWGPQQYGAQILDSTFQGHKTIATAILARQPDGLVVRRVVVRDFTDWGVVADTNVQSSVLRTPLVIEDVDVAGISRTVPRSADGKAEACIGVGNTGTVRRAKVRNCAWMGITTFNASHGSLLEDLDIDGTITGLYIEHYTSRNTFQRMRIGPNVENGVLSEGTDPNGPEWDGISSSIDNLIQDSTIDSTKVGVLMGWATTRTSVRRVTFRNQYVAAITDYKGINNSYTANDYSGIQQGAVPVSPVWWR